MKRIPRLEALEDRLAPAHDILIAGVPSASVKVTHAGNVTTFTATADDAKLSASAIIAEIDAGHDVVVGTGVGGTQHGDISVDAGDVAFDDLTGIRSVTFKAAGHIDFDSSLVDGDPGTPDALNLAFIAGGDVTLHQQLSDLTKLTVSARGKATLPAVSDVSNVSVTAAVIDLTGDIGMKAVGGLVSLSGNTTLAKDVTTDGALSLVRGTFDVSSHTLTAGVVAVGPTATLTGSGTVLAGLVSVGRLGQIKPVGVLHLGATVKLSAGSKLLLDVGSDSLVVSGPLTVATGAGVKLTGTPPAGPVLLVSAASLSGKFAGVAAGAKLRFGSRIETATYSAVGLTLAPAAVV